MDQLHLTLGLRYSEDDREIETQALASGFQFFSSSADDSWDDTSVDLTAAYDLTEDVNVYAKYVAGQAAKEVAAKTAH